MALGGEPTADELLGILCRTDLSPSARLAWQILLVETRAGRPWPSFARLAGQLGVTERWAREIVHELVDVGEIHRKSKYGAIRFPAVDGESIREVEEENFTAA